MVLQAEPIIKAVNKILKKIKKGEKVKIISLSPSGKYFDNDMAEKFKKFDHLVIICGRYEGIDQRVNKIFKTLDISIGNYTLTGGELPAMVLIDTITRRIKGVLGNNDSIEENRISSSHVYTRPEILTYKGKKYSVPKVLLSGNHKKINEWREKR
jgi:tRNA (guanine37-N1)-methyltransferase